MTILPNGARLYVAELLPLFDRREVKRFGWFKADEAIYLEVLMHGGRVHVIRHLPPAVDTQKIAIEIMEAFE
jgi:hypothetical protein